MINKFSFTIFHWQGFLVHVDQQVSLDKFRLQKINNILATFSLLSIYTSKFLTMQFFLVKENLARQIFLDKENLSTIPHLHEQFFLVKANLSRKKGLFRMSRNAFRAESLWEKWCVTSLYVQKCTQLPECPHSIKVTKYLIQITFYRLKWGSNKSKMSASVWPRFPGTEKQMKARGRRPCALSVEVSGDPGQTRRTSFWWGFSLVIRGIVSVL